MDKVYAVCGVAVTGPGDLEHEDFQILGVFEQEHAAESWASHLRAQGGWHIWILAVDWHGQDP